MVFGKKKKKEPVEEVEELEEPDLEVSPEELEEEETPIQPTKVKPGEKPKKVKGELVITKGQLMESGLFRYVVVSNKSLGTIGERFPVD